MNTIQRFLGHTEGIAFHEPVVIVYERELKALEQRAEKLEREICTCPWPADAMRTRHNLACRLMVMEHQEARAEEKA